MQVKTGYDAIGIEYQNAYSNNIAIKNSIVWLKDNLKHNDRILDVGSGTGIVAKQLSELGFQVTGIDNSNEMNRIARNQAPKAKFLEVNFKKFKLLENNFDAIIAFFSLLHVQKGIFNRTLQKILSYLKKDGFFVFSMVEGNIEGEEFYMGQKMYFSSFPREKLEKIIHLLALKILDFKENIFLPDIPGSEKETQLFYFTQK